MKENYVIVSACLAGINCRYDGKNNKNEKVLKFMEKNKCILVCPEQLGGLPTPRTPAEIIKDKVIDKNGKDVTQNFLTGAKEALKIAKLYKAQKALLKAKSPSCGSKEVYDGTHSGKLIKGKGITAELFENNEIEVINENDI